jgi:hypothetical protein
MVAAFRGGAMLLNIVSGAALLLMVARLPIFFAVHEPKDAPAARRSNVAAVLLKPKMSVIELRCVGVYPLGGCVESLLCGNDADVR